MNRAVVRGVLAVVLCITSSLVVVQSGQDIGAGAKDVFDEILLEHDHLTGTLFVFVGLPGHPVSDALALLHDELLLGPRPRVPVAARSLPGARGTGRPPKPVPVTPVFDNIPMELRRHARWVLWRYVLKADWKPGDPKPWTKVPYRADGKGKASSTDASTWASFDVARDAYERGEHGADGVGWVIGEGIVGGDIDGCRGPQTGTLSPEAERVVRDVDTYTEVSPSGAGVRFFALGELPPKGRKRGVYEMYDGDGGRYLTVTGALLDGAPATIRSRTEALARVHAQHIAHPERPKVSVNDAPVSGRGRHLSDAEVLEAMRRNRRNGADLGRLYAGDLGGYGGDHSAADLALVNALVWWCDGDAEQVDRLFRASGLMRDKWNRNARRGETYGEGTIREALEGFAAGTGYQGRRELNTADMAPPPRDAGDPGPDPSVVEVKTEPKRKATSSKVKGPKVGGEPSMVRAPILKRLSSVEPEAVEHLDDGRLVLSKLTLLVGDAGIGKTHIALACAANVTRGRPIFPPALSPGSRPRPAANVLAFIGEDGLADTIRTRFDDAEGDPDRFVVLTGLLTANEDGRVVEGEVDLKQLDVIEQALGDVRPALVIVDPVQLYLGAGVDMHRANEVRGALKGIAKLAATYRAALLVIAHLNKGNGKALYRALGSVDFVAIARSVLVAGVHDGTPALAHAKANLSPRAPTLTYSLERGRLEWKGTSEASADEITGHGRLPNERPREAEAIDWLRAYLLSGPRRAVDVAINADGAGIAERTLRRATESLGVVKRRVGSIGAEGHWEWSLSDA